MNCCGRIRSKHSREMEDHMISKIKVEGSRNSAHNNIFEVGKPMPGSTGVQRNMKKGQEGSIRVRKIEVKGRGNGKKYVVTTSAPEKIEIMARYVKAVNGKSVVEEEG